MLYAFPQKLFISLKQLNGNEKMLNNLFISENQIILVKNLIILLVKTDWNIVCLSDCVNLYCTWASKTARLPFFVFLNCGYLVVSLELKCWTNLLLSHLYYWCYLFDVWTVKTQGFINISNNILYDVLFLSRRNNLSLSPKHSNVTLFVSYASKKLNLVIKILVWLNLRSCDVLFFFRLILWYEAVHILR